MLYILSCLHPRNAKFFCVWDFMKDSIDYICTGPWFHYTHSFDYEFWPFYIYFCLDIGLCTVTCIWNPVLLYIYVTLIALWSIVIILVNFWYGSVHVYTYAVPHLSICNTPIVHVGGFVTGTSLRWPSIEKKTACFYFGTGTYLLYTVPHIIYHYLPLCYCYPWVDFFSFLFLHFQLPLITGTSLTNLISTRCILIDILLLLFLVLVLLNNLG